MSESGISIKGLGDSLLITVGEGTWEENENALIERIESQGDFFRGATVALKVGDHVLDREDIKRLQDRLSKHDVRLSSLLGTSAETIRSARRMELDTDLDEKMSNEELEYKELPPIDAQEYGSAGVLVKHTLRSGRIVKHSGHIVIIGDVNPGSQVIAGGDILIWGRLRGTVHAGAGGDDEAVVCALDMRPTQLRIANYVAIAEDSGKPRPTPEIAFVKDGQIAAEEWGRL